MGIRCYCPQGHKLNVKAEQAGKIGICPKCKVIRRKGVLRVICENPRHKQRQG